jgi:hypothetical protein
MSLGTFIDLESFRLIKLMIRLCGQLAKQRCVKFQPAGLERCILIH